MTPLRAAPFLAVPAILVGLSLWSERLIYPLHGSTPGYDYDPAYVYLMNAVSLINGEQPLHIDHPGTPVQIVVAAIIAAWWAVFSQAGPLLDNVISDPEKYILVTGRVFLVFNAISSWYLGYAVAKAARSTGTGVLAQSGILWLGAIFPHVVYLSPEAMLCGLTMLLLGVLAPEIFRCGNQDLSTKRALVAGALGGIAITAKATFAPMLVLLLVIRSRGRLAAAALAVVVAALVALLPIYSRIPDLIRWLVALALRQGHYGAGAYGLPPWSAMLDRLATFSRVLPVVWVALVLAATRLVRADRTALAFFVVLAVQVLLAAKFTEPRYFIAVVPLSTVVVAWFAQTWSGARAQAIGAAAMVCVACLWTGAALHALRAERTARVNEVRELARIINEHPKDALVIASYRVPDRTYGLNFGLGYTRFGTRIAATATQALPSDLSYHVSGALVRLASGYLPPTTLNQYVAAGRTVLVVVPMQVPLDGVECREPMRSTAHYRVCDVVRVVERMTPAERAPDIPSLSGAEVVPLRIPLHLLERFLADGPGWQDRIVDALRRGARE